MGAGDRQIKCEWCGVDIRNCDEGECDNCNYIRTAIEHNPDAALKILQELIGKDSADTPGDRSCPICGISGDDFDKAIRQIRDEKNRGRFQKGFRRFLDKKIKENSGRYR